MRSHSSRPRARRGRRGSSHPEPADAPAPQRATSPRPPTALRSTLAPAVGLGAATRARPGFAEATVARAEEELSVPGSSGRGEPSFATAFGGAPLRIQGRTDATYDGGSYATEGVTATRGMGCRCTGSPCLHVVGTLRAPYSVSTTVTLPRAADYAGLTDCQRQRVQTAIDTVLAPHEQEHVAAFRTYDGSTSRAFDLTLCRSEFDSAIQRMFEAEERARRAAAQAASDALDPFHFDVDIDCTDRSAATAGDAGTHAAPPAEPETP